VCGNLTNLGAIYSIPQYGNYTPCGFWTVPAGSLDEITELPCAYSNNTASVTAIGYNILHTFIWTETNTLFGNCSSTDTVQIEFIENPTANAGPDQAVCGNTATLNAALSSGSEGVWSGTGTFANVNDPNTTVANQGVVTYTWTVSNHNTLLPNYKTCPASDVVIITFYVPTPAIINIDENYANYCGETHVNIPGILKAVISGSGNYSGVWECSNGGATITNPTNPIAGITLNNYNVEYVITWTTNVVGATIQCTSTDTFRITLREIPKITLADNATICGNTISLTGSVIPQTSTTTWTTTTNIDIATPSNLTTTVSCNQFNNYGTYLLSFTAHNFNCDASKNINVTFKELPSTDFTIIPPKCFGEEAILIADTTKYQSYAWDYGPQFPSHERVRYSNTQGGIYSTFVSWEVNPADTINGHEIPHTVTLTVSNNGCTGIPETIDIVEPGVHESRPAIVKDTCKLAIGEIRLNNNGLASYLWLPELYEDLTAQGLATFNSDYSIISNLPYGSYSVQRTYPSTNTDPQFIEYYNSVFGNKFCIDTITYTVDTIGMMHAYADISPLIDVNTLVIPAEVVFVNNSDYGGVTKTCEWHFGDGTSVLRDCNATVTHTYEVPGEYHPYLVIMNSKMISCRDTSDVLLLTIDNSSHLNVPNVFTPNGDGINDYFQVDAESLKSFHGEIRNRWGEKMFEWTDWQTFSAGWDGKSKISTNAASGVYYYVIKAKGLDNADYNLEGFLHLIRGNE
jgi:gliding motility-associated-like protein